MGITRGQGSCPLGFEMVNMILAYIKWLKFLLFDNKFSPAAPFLPTLYPFFQFILIFYKINKKIKLEPSNYLSSTFGRELTWASLRSARLPYFKSCWTAPISTRYIAQLPVFYFKQYILHCPYTLLFVYCVDFNT